MLFINKKDMARVGQEIIQDGVKKAYGLFLDQSCTMPDRIHVEDNKNSLLFMPCFGKDYFATKLISVFPDAPLFHQPSVNGVMILSDNRTGRPLALMDGAAITAERTGAVGGLCVSLLTAGDIETAGIIGAGVQGLSQARYLLFNRKIKKLWISSLHPASARKMVETLEQEFPDVDYIIPGSVEELVADSELVIAATTSMTPLFKNDHGLVRGKTFISIGSFRPDMREFPDAVILNADHIYVDTPFAAKESGDIFIPLEKGLISPEKIKPFSDLLHNRVSLENKTCFFKSVGMALFDLAVASALYEFALRENMGQKLDF